MPKLPQASIRFKQEVERLTREAIRLRDPQFFEQAIRAYILREDLPKRMLIDARTMRKEVEQQEERKWIEEHSLVIPNLADDLTKSTKLYADNVVESLRRGILKNENEDQLLKRVRRADDTLVRYQQTILNTARAAIAREATVAAIATARLPNTNADPYMRYDGGETSERSRDFCVRTKGQVRRMSEWGRMVNQFGQSVLLYCGGWNCAHRLTVLLDYDPKTYKPETYR